MSCVGKTVGTVHTPRTQRGSVPRETSRPAFPLPRAPSRGDRSWPASCVCCAIPMLCRDGKALEPHAARRDAWAVCRSALPFNHRDCLDGQDRSDAPRSAVVLLPCRNRIDAGKRQSAGAWHAYAPQQSCFWRFYDFCPSAARGLGTRRDDVHAFRDMVLAAGLGRSLDMHHFRVDPHGTEARPVAATRIAVQKRRMSFRNRPKAMVESVGG